MGPRPGRRPYYDSAGNGRTKQEESGLVRLHEKGQELDKFEASYKRMSVLPAALLLIGTARFLIGLRVSGRSARHW